MRNVGVLGWAGLAGRTGAFTLQLQVAFFPELVSHVASLTNNRG